MGSSDAMRPLAMLPEMLLFGAGLACLLGGSFTPRRRQWVERGVAAVGFAGCAVVALVEARAGGTAFEGAFTVDVGTTTARVVVGVAGLLVLGLASDELAGSDRESETYALLLLATTGTLVLAGARDLLVLAVGFLLASIPLYGLVGLGRTGRAAEAALKTYLVGALLGIFLLLGVTLVYGVAGTTSYAGLASSLTGAPTAVVAAGVIAVLAAVAFEAGSVPAHFWVPDAAQGSTGVAAAFATTVPKIGAVVAAYRLVDVLPHTLDWGAVVAVLAAASMTLGNLAAFGQDDPRRLLGWSTVSQVGYLLVPVAVATRSDLALPALLVYVLAYTVTNLCCFAVTSAVPDARDLPSYAGLVRRHPVLAVALVVGLLGLVGTPPTIVFVAKLTAATAAWDGGMAWLTVLLLANTLASLYYYLRWIAPALGRTGQEAEAGTRTVRPWSAGVAVTAAALTILLGVLSGPVLALLQDLGRS